MISPENPSSTPDRGSSSASESASEKRGQLKVFFGSAPGVGKTTAMLRSAQRLASEGTDVVVGAVESHGRAEIDALASQLEALRGSEGDRRPSKELDLEAALARRPGLLLVDDLAHVNPPGARHPKRWQDVTDLLAAGIDVHTTLGVEDVESLTDVVARITGVRASATVPDAMVDRADDLELCELSPDALLARYREGKVKAADAGGQATQALFQRGNLVALRELALRCAAEWVGAETEAHRRGEGVDAVWATRDRILVCVGPSPFSAELVRATRRMAARAHAPWIAASVIDPLGSSAVEERRLEENLALAESLGGEVARLTHPHVGEAILAYARERNVTRVVVGKPLKNEVGRFGRSALVDDIIRGSGDIDVLVIRSETEPAPPSSATPPTRAGRALVAYAWAAVAIAITTGAGFLVKSIMGTEELVMLYLLAIMIVALRLYRGPAFLAATLSVAAFDFFFVPPAFTFAVKDPRQLLTFGVMFAVGLVISSLTVRVRRQEEGSRVREARTHLLYELGRELGGARDESMVSEIACRRLSVALGAEVWLFVREGDAPTQAARSGERALPADDLEVVIAAFDRRRPAGAGTDTLGTRSLVAFPLVAREIARGVLVVRRRETPALEPNQTSLLESVARQVGAELDRMRLAVEAGSAAMRARTEELRSALLSAVSHDLRTPLAAITGAATTLRDDSDRIPQAQQRDLIESVCDEAERLERLLANLLDMTRLESGGMEVKKEWIPVEEVVGAALTRLEQRLGDREVKVSIPDDTPLVAIDPVLFAQVLLNLVENAIKYTPSDSPIELRARATSTGVEIAVEDRGPGLPAGRESTLFEKFVRGQHPGIGGVGLGLAISRGIVAAHGGTIGAVNRTEGGASFRIQLPGHGAPPSMLDDDPREAQPPMRPS